MKIIRLEEIDSTNNYAKSFIEDFDDKTVICANSQTNGRGRLNRKWLDLGPGNLFFSIVLKPSDEFKNVYSNLTQYASVILCKIFEKYGLNPKIKWPNDVMIDGKRKISGILCETVIDSGKLRGIVLGIGVNLRASKTDIDSIKDRIVTSLNIETDLKVEPEEFLNDFLTEFFKDYDKLLNKGFYFIEQDYINRNCFLEKELSIQVLSEIKTGYAKSLTHDGELILENNKKELVLTIGDIL